MEESKETPSIKKEKRANKIIKTKAEIPGGCLSCLLNHSTQGKAVLFSNKTRKLVTPELSSISKLLQ